MDKITEDLGKLTAAVQKINDSLEKVDDRVAQCEFFCKSKSEKDKFEQVENSSHIGVNQDTPTLVGRYRSIRKTVQKSLSLL